MIEHITKSNEGKNNYKEVKKRHCWNSKEDINSQQYDTCDSCRGIVCSCGACFCGWEDWY